DDDLDQDGVLFAQDCNDTNASISPLADEAPHDQVDNDCDLAIDCEDSEFLVGDWIGVLHTQELPLVCDGYCARAIQGDLYVQNSTLTDLQALHCVTS